MVKSDNFMYDGIYFDRFYFEEKIEDQIYRIEFDLIDTRWDIKTNSWLRFWNVVQAVFEEGQDFYSIDETKITGKNPMRTFGVAKRGLEECMNYLTEQYIPGNELGWEDIHEKCCDIICAGWADEKRHHAYERVLRKMGWTSGIDLFDEECMVYRIFS